MTDNSRFDSLRLSKIRSSPMVSYPILSSEERNHAKACPAREKERLGA